MLIFVFASNFNHGRRKIHIQFPRANSEVTASGGFAIHKVSRGMNLKYFERDFSYFCIDIIILRMLNAIP